MSREFDFGTLPRLSPGASVRVADTASDSSTQISSAHSDVPRAYAPSSNHGSTDPCLLATNDRPSTTRTRCRFAPFDEHLNELIDIPRWQQDLDNYFVNVFTPSALLTDPIADVVARALLIVALPTQDRIRGLAQSVYMYWVRMQCRYRDADAFVPIIVALVSGITHCLSRTCAGTQKVFTDELSRLCIEKLKLTWRLYNAVITGKVWSMSHQDLLTQTMAVVTIIGHLFEGSLLHYSVALNGLKYIVSTLPWPDTFPMIVYTFLYKLGLNFAMKQGVWRFIQRLLTDLLPLAVGRVHVDPVYQLIFAIKTLVTEWDDRISRHAIPVQGGATSCMSTTHECD